MAFAKSGPAQTVPAGPPEPPLIRHSVVLAKQSHVESDLFLRKTIKMYACTVDMQSLN